MLLNHTGLTTICVSQATIGAILDLASKEKISKLKNIVLYDQLNDIQITLATQLGLRIWQFDDLVRDGLRSLDVRK